jgi:hypothetical protein
MNAQDDDLNALHRLPQTGPSQALADRVRRQAHAELARSRGYREWIALGWLRVALPVGITLTVVGYLRWAIESASAIYR